jgi:hypothetical protein
MSRTFNMNCVQANSRKTRSREVIMQRSHRNEMKKYNPCVLGCIRLLMSAYITHMLQQVLKKLPKKCTPVFSIMSPFRQIISIPNGRFAGSFAWRSCHEKVRSQKLLC